MQQQKSTKTRVSIFVTSSCRILEKTLIPFCWEVVCDNIPSNLLSTLQAQSAVLASSVRRVRRVRRETVDAVEQQVQRGRDSHCGLRNALVFAYSRLSISKDCCLQTSAGKRACRAMRAAGGMRHGVTGASRTCPEAVAQAGAAPAAEFRPSRLPSAASALSQLRVASV